MDITTLTVKQKFSAIRKTEKTLSKYANATQETDKKGFDTYFVVQDHLIKMLREFLQDDFTTLSKENFLHLCDMVSTHRPVALHSFLISISNRKKEKGE